MVGDEGEDNPCSFLTFSLFVCNKCKQQLKYLSFLQKMKKKSEIQIFLLGKTFPFCSCDLFFLLLSWWWRGVIKRGKRWMEFNNRTKTFLTKNFISFLFAFSAKSSKNSTQQLTTTMMTKTTTMTSKAIKL